MPVPKRKQRERAEVFWAALPGLATLTRAGRLPPGNAERRVELLVDRLVIDRPTIPGGQCQARDRAMPSRMSCSLTTISVRPARTASCSATVRTMRAPPPITSTRPG